MPLSNIFIFISKNFGSNVYLLKDKINAIIDSSNRENSNSIKNFLSAHGLTPKDISFVLHTHGHADHFGCTNLFPNAKKYMHKFDAGFVNAKDENFCMPLTKPDFPTITHFFENNQVFDFGKTKLTAIFTPGHTQGSICLYEKKQKALFSGDTIFVQGFGRTDLPSGNITHLQNSIKKLQKLNFNILLPGHGPISQ